jgi:uncharacterized cupredoxin-like copper-binding protein
MNRITLALGVALAALVAAAPVAASPAMTPPTVTVTMKEFKFTLTKKVVVSGKTTIKLVTSVKHGKVLFRLVNKGKLKHDFSIAGRKSALIAPGKTGTLLVTLRAGKLAYKCTVAGHAAAGMKGKLTVT